LQAAGAEKAPFFFQGQGARAEKALPNLLFTK